MAKIIAIVNQKGGVGKTTTCVNLAAAVKAAGKRVLLCDFDPQANATSGMGVDKTTSNGVYDALINGVDTAQLIVTTPYGDVLPSSKALAGAGVELASLPDRQFLLKAALRQVADNYDFIFIDCPPSLELLTLNALCAANTLLVPVQGEYYALEGVSDLMSVSAKRPATASPSPPMTAPAAARMPIRRWPRSSCKRTAERRTSYGKSDEGPGQGPGRAAGRQCALRR